MSMLDEACGLVPYFCIGVFVVGSGLYLFVYLLFEATKLILGLL
jgi:hypothetical protein